MDRGSVQRLRELGWTEGHTVTIEYRWAEGSSDRFSEMAAEFVRLRVDVIVTVGSAVTAAIQQTSTIPIVFAIATLCRLLSRSAGALTAFVIRPVKVNRHQNRGDVRHC
jgi:ABC-type uncharacterized transport system substrate-binding protein